MLTSGALATGRRDKRGRVKPAQHRCRPDDDGYLAASLVPWQPSHFSFTGIA